MQKTLLSPQKKKVQTVLSLPEILIGMLSIKNNDYFMVPALLRDTLPDIYGR